MNCKVNEQGWAEGDLSAQRIAYLLWGPPALFLLAGVLSPEARVWLWTPALLVAGAACLVNAARCGRFHCHFTGPLFLLAAAASVLRGLEIVSVRCIWIGWFLIGGTLLAFVPEWIVGKYAKFKSK
jgi:hypothetical protein